MFIISFRRGTFFILDTFDCKFVGKTHQCASLSNIMDLLGVGYAFGLHGRVHGYSNSFGVSYSIELRISFY